MSNGIGRALRVERERRRVSLETIARATMVRRDYLELIDEDRLDELPAGAYAKGFIRAYANYLGLDPLTYVKAYEQYCAQPEPELSAVVRHPVRVPNAAQPRAWRVAAGAAVAMLMLLGLLGVFRSGEPVAEAPEIAANVARTLSSPQPNPLGAVVRVEIVGDSSWVQAEVDGDEVFADTMRRGDKQTFRGARTVYLILGDATAVRVVANGTDVGTPVEPTYRGTFTPRTVDLPPAQPQ